MQRSPLDLSADQPTIAPLPEMISSSLGALERGETHYVDAYGIAPLREQLALYLQQMGIGDGSMARVMAVSALQECRFLALQMLGEKLGETQGVVGLPTIIHPGARLALGVRERAIIDIDVAFDATSDAQTLNALPTPAAIEAALQQGARLLYLESPSRLTGASYDADTLTTIAALIEQYNAAVIWDQGLAPWVEHYVSLAAVPTMSDCVIAIGEAWPGLGLESWPMSYLSGKNEWLDIFRIQKQVISICTNTASQYAALAASYSYTAVHAEQMQKLAAAQQALFGQLARIGVEPLAGDTLTLVALRANDAVIRKLNAAGLQWAEGAAFGAPGIIRLSVSFDGALTNDGALTKSLA